jgi:hypothetical protein
VTGEPKKRRGRLITPRNRRVFLQLLAEGAVVREAADATGHARQRFYELRRSDPVFAAEWDAAFESGTDVIEQEAIRRSMEGYDETTFDAQGNVLRRVHRYSDSLLQTLLRGRRYHEQRIEIGGSQARPIVVEHTLTLRQGLERIAARHRKEALESGRPLPPELALPKAGDTWPVLEAEPNKSDEGGARDERLRG